MKISDKKRTLIYKTTPGVQKAQNGLRAQNEPRAPGLRGNSFWDIITGRAWTRRVEAKRAAEAEKAQADPRYWERPVIKPAEIQENRDAALLPKPGAIKGISPAIKTVDTTGTGPKYTEPKGKMPATKKAAEKEAAEAMTPEQAAKDRKIRAYQERFKKLGLYDGEIDGMWGKDTQSAYDKVVAAQKRLKSRGLYDGAIDGIVGNKTRTAMENELKKGPVQGKKAGIPKSKNIVAAPILRGGGLFYKK